MEVLIVGSTGFIGQEIHKKLEEEGFEVYTAGRSGELDYYLDLTKNSTFENLPDVDAVVNAAGLGELDGLESDSKEWDLVNVEGTSRLAENFSDSIFIHISSLSANGLIGDYEKNSDEPRLPYSKSKKASEEAVKRKAESSIIIRPGFVYEKDRHDKIQKIFSKAGLIPTNKRKTVAISRESLSEKVVKCLENPDVDSPILAGESIYPEQLAYRTGLEGREIYIPNTLILFSGLIGEFMRYLGFPVMGSIRSRSIISDQEIDNSL